MTNATMATTTTLKASAPRAGERFHADVWRDAIALAVLAPSSHNSQPWLFHLHPAYEAAELYADRTRALPVADPEGRELVISCGAALFTLRMALQAAGFGSDVELLPDAADRDLLARVHLRDARAATPEELALAAAIPRRRTTRTRFEPRAIPIEVVAALREAAVREGATLAVLHERPDRERLADLVADADRLQGEDPAFRRELASWLRSDGSASGDGMPGYAIGHPGLASYLGPWVVRTFDLGEGQAARDRELASGSPLMVILSTAADDATAWMQVGQALARVLLTAEANDVTASFLNQPIEVAGLRSHVRTAFAIGGSPQLVLRLGYAPRGRATPRRPVGDVLA